MKKALVSILLIFNVLAVLALFISYVSIYISPDKYWIPSLFGLVYPVILVINLLFILFWFFVKPKNVLLSIISILIGWGLVGRHFQIKGRSAENGDVKVLSYNVRFFQGDGTNNQTENANEIIRFLEEQNADIICLQEVRLNKKSIFNLANTVGKLKSVNHYQYARTSTTYGSVTMTRYPIVNMGEIRFKNSRNITIYTDVIIQNDTVRIINAHLQSYQINPSDYSIIDSPGITEDEDIEQIKEVAVKYKKALELRAEQVREIRKYIDDSPHQVLVCGDFNDTPASYSYRKLQSGLKDAFVYSGKGIGPTYMGKLPPFRIDYIFHSNGFESYNFSTVNFKMSDHLPVTCDLVKLN